MTAPVLPIRQLESIQRALALMQAGEMVILPTDTVYGIAISPDNIAGIARMYEVHEREPEPALPFLLSSARFMEVLARVTKSATKLARRFWPGPLTLILPPGPDLEPELRTMPIALRVPNYQPLHALLKSAGGYLIATGALRPGCPPAITAQEAAEQFGDTVSLILDGGPSPYGIPSTILDCVPEPPIILRRGTLSEDKIWAALGMKSLSPRSSTLKGTQHLG